MHQYYLKSKSQILKPRPVAKRWSMDRQTGRQADKETEKETDRRGLHTTNRGVEIFPESERAFPAYVFTETMC
jgi:hypothetical protein